MIGTAIQSETLRLLADVGALVLAFLWGALGTARTTQRARRRP